MKIHTLIIGKGMIVALIAPVATASPINTVPRLATGHQKSAQSSTAITKLASHAISPGVYFAPWPSSPIVTPRYIYVPGFSGPPSIDAEPDCASSGANCTPRQLCDIWGENCPAPDVAPPLTAAQP